MFRRNDDARNRKTARSTFRSAVVAMGPLCRSARARNHLEVLEQRLCMSATFSSASSYDAGGIPDFIAAADFNGDGKRDLVVSSYNGSNLNLLLGNGNGTFGDPTAIALTDAPDFVTSGDVNG